MIAVAFAVVVSTITIDAPDACPSAAAIAEALSPMLPAGGARAAQQRVAVAVESDGAVRVRFLDGAGSATGTRRLDAGPDCGERARAVAVVVAARQLQLDAAIELRPPAALAPDPSPAEAPIAILRPAPRPARVAYDVSAAFTSSFGGGFAAGGAAAIALGRPGGHFAGRLTVSGGDTRTLALGQGSVAWARAALAAGALCRLRKGRFVFDFDADFVAALLVVDGHGYVADERSLNFDPGLAAGVRFGVRWRQLEPFVGVSIVGWLRREEIDARTLDATANLPQLETLLAVGASFGTF